MTSIEDRLKGGHANSLGNTIEVVTDILNKPILFNELFEAYFSEDEVVRLRVSNAMKRIAKVNKALLIPKIDRFLNEITQIDQASTQWTLSQLFDLLVNDLNATQKEKAKQHMQNNLHHQDWIVLNQTMNTLGKWALSDTELKSWIIPELERITKDSRKSVAKTAQKHLLILTKTS